MIHSAGREPEHRWLSLTGSFSGRSAKKQREDGFRPQRSSETHTSKLLIGQENKTINTDAPPPSDGTRCRPPFINQPRNGPAALSLPLLIICSQRCAGHLAYRDKIPTGRHISGPVNREIIHKVFTTLSLYVRPLYAWGECVAWRCFQDFQLHKPPPPSSPSSPTRGPGIWISFPVHPCLQLFQGTAFPKGLRG